MKYAVFTGILIFFLKLSLTLATNQEQALFHPLDKHLSETYADDLQDLLERRYIRVLTTINKTNFFISGGEVFGFEYSLLKEYEKFLNQSIRNRELKITLEFIPVSRDRLISNLLEGYGDIAAAGLTITKERLKKVDFTAPYLTAVDELLVTHKLAPKPRSIKDLTGYSVFVRESSSYFESLMALNQELMKAGKRPVKIVKADENLETEDILEMVNTGAIERTVCDSHLGKIWSGVLHDIKAHQDIKLRTGGQIAWVVRKNNPNLKKNLNRFIEKHRKGTLMGNILFKQYYQDNAWIKNPLRGEGKKKLKAHEQLFQKYATEYGFDWRLIMAMAFQESGLDHNKKSHRGAVGILQIRPETAADSKIGISNIHRLENNIQAGVKYLAFLRDHYFNDPEIRPRDKVRFSLAAYNAGPAKIRKTRELAGRLGLNPSRWFRNVELAVLQVVGQETVRYVSNINKYYVIYRNALVRSQARENAIKKKYQKDQ
ncbi:MAG: lytic transglycosylase F [Desulfobacteraceae bacterium]|nr:lytic transglycosylase F [Desulfobacteraceae bacterium]